MNQSRWIAEQLEGIQDDTVLMPYVIADAVLSELVSSLNSVNPTVANTLYGLRDKLTDHLVTRGNDVYANNIPFAKRMNGPGTSGRDYLYTFMRHWLSAELAREYPKIWMALDPDQQRRFANGESI